MKCILYFDAHQKSTHMCCLNIGLDWIGLDHDWRFEGTRFLQWNVIFDLRFWIFVLLCFGMRTFQTFNRYSNAIWNILFFFWHFYEIFVKFDVSCFWRCENSFDSDLIIENDFNLNVIEEWLYENKKKYRIVHKFDLIMNF